MNYWDPVTGIFVDDMGDAIGIDAITTILEDSLSASFVRMLEVVTSSTTGRSSFIAMSEIVKREYIRQYLIGIGGINNMTFSDWGSIGGMLREQYSYLRKFADELMSGNLTEAQVNARISMYVNSAREAYNRARGKVVKKLGYDEVGWDLSPIQDHCDTCLERSQMGYVPIGPKGGFMHMGHEVFPGDGSSDCLTNDKCGLSYRNSTTGAEYSL